MADRRTLILVGRDGRHVMLMWRGGVRFPGCWKLGEFLGEGSGHVERAVEECDLARLDAWAAKAQGSIIALDENGRGIPRV